MREAIYQLLTELYPGVPVFQKGAVDNNPPKPFIIYNLGGEFRGVTRTSAHRTARAEFWVHDMPGSYKVIEGMLTSIERVFDNAVHVNVGNGGISQAMWDSRSPDLDDMGFGTICKSTNYTVVGRG